MGQNTTHAVMSQRFEPNDSADDFPTPPWATRALFEYVIPASSPKHSCLEPACGEGHMSKVLQEYFSVVHISDKYDYSDYGEIRDFVSGELPYESNSFDWVITNPPFNLAEKFVSEALRVSRDGVAILARTVFLESSSRYFSLFQKSPLSIFAQFVERVPMVKGRLDEKASTATGYAWFVWQKDRQSYPRLMWIPPCRKMLERYGDYPPRKVPSLNLNDLVI